MISLHTSPLLQPGAGDSGGMNVYVRELVSALAQAGVECTTFTRADRAGLPREVLVEPGHRVVHIEAGPHHLPKEALPDVTDLFRAGVLDWVDAHEQPDVIHGNYWLSGVVGHRLKHDLDVPFVSTFHTLARVKAEGGDPEPIWRETAEAEIVAAPTRSASAATRRSSSSGACTATRRAGWRSSPPASSTRSSPQANAPAPAVHSGSTSIVRCCCSSVGSSRSRAPTSRCARSPNSADPTPSS